MVEHVGIETILNTVKHALGGGLVSYSDMAFDEPLLMHINSTFVILNQLGVGPKEIFIADKSSTWDNFLSESSENLNLVKSYLFLRVRLLFDPPSNSFITEAIKDQIKEFEWRLNVYVDHGEDNQNE